jgi:NAD(P)-dependent dehydrogenase (short-subunit alcohol dehydrogenase family)
LCTHIRTFPTFTIDKTTDATEIGGHARRSTRGATRAARDDAADPRNLRPADIAALAVHLMANTAITGATFEIDGGQPPVEH